MSMAVQTKAAVMLLAASALSIMGCSKTVTESELVGTYVAKYPFGTERISLDANGEYTQEFTPSTTDRQASAKGRWSYNQATGYVSFENCLIVHDLDGKLATNYNVPKNGLSVLPASRLFRITIGISDDRDWEYVKQGS
jgi:hypothetical protein